MQEIMWGMTVANPSDPSKCIDKVGLIDTGSAFPVLPASWKERLGPFPISRPHRLETADRRVVEGEICGPLLFTIQGFPPVSTEVLFLPMGEDESNAFPIIGHLVLQQAGVIVDLVTHRLFPRPHSNLKPLRVG